MAAILYYWFNTTNLYNLICRHELQAVLETSAYINKADSRWFYRDLPVLESFEQAANSFNHTSVPDDWFIVICDVCGSTKAIEEGKYKHVNAMGAATIVAVLNVNRTIPIPYVFGGDGASLAIPPCMELGVRQALLGAQSMARDGFGFDLRVGLVSVAKAKQEGHGVALARYSLGPGMTQAALGGLGWDRAERLLKDEKTRHLYEVVAIAELAARADFTGFECRWQPVAARKEHKLAILVQSLSSDGSKQPALYSKVLSKISSIYGDFKETHPLDARHLLTTLSPKELFSEITLKTASLSWAKKLRFVFSLGASQLLARGLFRWGLCFTRVDWSKYRDDVVQNADFRKFDGTLKMVVDGSEQQQRELKDFLEEEFKQANLVYGLHASKQAIVTCLVFSRHEQHCHFIDGSEGGYTMAAKMLKKKIASSRPSLTRYC